MLISIFYLINCQIPETTINTYGDIYNYYKQKETQKVIDYLKRERA